MTLSKQSQKSLLVCKYQALPATTLYTAKGPAVGTIWFNKSVPTRSPFTVLSIGNGIVLYEDDGWDHLARFHAEVQGGGYILIGMQHTVIPTVPNLVA